MREVEREGRFADGTTPVPSPLLRDLERRAKDIALEALKATSPPGSRAELRARYLTEQGRRIDQTHKREAVDSPCVASMTSLNLSERMNEMSDGVIRPSNATREGRRETISGIPVKTLLGGASRLWLLAMLALAMDSTSAQAAPFAYVTHPGFDNVSVINTTTNTVVATVAVGSPPFGIAITPF